MQHKQTAHVNGLLGKVHVQWNGLPSWVMSAPKDIIFQPPAAVMPQAFTQHLR